MSGVRNKMQKGKRRVRSSNFSLKEKSLLIHLASKYKNVLENKKTDSLWSQEKNKAWHRIAEEFNFLSPDNTHRNADTLRTWYRNRRKIVNYKAKREMASDNVKGETIYELEHPSDIVSHFMNTFSNCETSDDENFEEAKAQIEMLPEAEEQINLEPLAMIKSDKVSIFAEKQILLLEKKIAMAEFQMEAAKKEHMLKISLLELQIQNEELKLKQHKDPEAV
ncbi:fibrinogen silencer-binding protein-like [Cylas formicarius]|uniref:fibrinogen silencer-binding protein-like n=1 Tax=Cylas formicarius TaxID=197179 RepID=UPI0029588080|nr:fibrinogen silencer-binding protein-like [Cylas formicarius]